MTLNIHTYRSTTVGKNGKRNIVQQYFSLNIHTIHIFVVSGYGENPVSVGRSHCIGCDVTFEIVYLLCLHNSQNSIYVKYTSV